MSSARSRSSRSSRSASRSVSRAAAPAPPSDPSDPLLRMYAHLSAAAATDDDPTAAEASAFAPLMSAPTAPATVTRRKKASERIAAAGAPWIRGGIDYGPMRAALQDLSDWVFNIAESSVEDWSSARAHIRATRRYVDAQIHGYRARRVTIEDVMFTAQLLARIFEADLGLDMSDALTILNSLALPTEVVAVARPSRSAREPSMSHTVDPDPQLGRRVASSITSSTMSTPASVPPLRWCDDCGVVHELGAHLGHRNAA